VRSLGTRHEKRNRRDFLFLQFKRAAPFNNVATRFYPPFLDSIGVTSLIPDFTTQTTMVFIFKAKFNTTLKVNSICTILYTGVKHQATKIVNLLNTRLTLRERSVNRQMENTLTLFKHNGPSLHCFCWPCAAQSLELPALDELTKESHKFSRHDGAGSVSGFGGKMARTPVDFLLIQQMMLTMWTDKATLILSVLEFNFLF
jgi:hypothetical protein